MTQWLGHRVTIDTLTPTAELRSVGHAGCILSLQNDWTAGRRSVRKHQASYEHECGLKSILYPCLVLGPCHVLVWCRHWGSSWSSAPNGHIQNTRCCNSSPLSKKTETWGITELSCTIDPTIHVFLSVCKGSSDIIKSAATKFSGDGTKYFQSQCLHIISKNLHLF